MEVTLEKIELVKDRTGVSYKEAKDALEAADGSVVDAIIAIEDSIDNMEKKTVSDQGAQILDNVKAVLKKGNVSKITVRKNDGDVLLNLPVNAGIVAALVAPWGVLAGILSTFAFKCVIEIVKDDGTVVEISERANDVLGKVTEKGSDLADVTKQKAAEVADATKEKAGEVYGKIKENDTLGKVADKAEETWDNVSETVKSKVKKVADDVEDAVEDAVEDIEEKIDEWTEEEPKEAPAEDVEEAVEEADE